MARKPQKRAATGRSGGAKRGRSGVSRRAAKERTPTHARKTRSIRPNRKKKPKKTWRKAKLQVSWRKGAVGALYGVAAILAGAAVTYGGHQAYLHVTTTELFALETIEVNGLSRATRDEVMSLAEVAEGHNLIALDASMMEERIERHPWVITADVMRRPPRSLEIAVVEHEPVALASLEGLYFATADGEVVKRYDGEEVTLPVVTGLRVRRTDRAHWRRHRRHHSFSTGGAPSPPDHPNKSAWRPPYSKGLARPRSWASTGLARPQGAGLAQA